MAEKILMKGNEALGEAAIQAGCRFFFGYPITPQTELPQYMSVRMPEVGGLFLQAESEISSINMVYGAAGCGARVMTSSSSPGISLKLEGISYIAGAELPAVIVNMMRGGPGLGNIQPSQADYFQATKGGGHGDYRMIVLAPNSIQELVDLTMEAFDLADLYRNPVMILGDGILGQMMEPVEFKPPVKRELPPKDWATTGSRNGGKKLINSLYIVAEDNEEHLKQLLVKYARIEAAETRWQEYRVEDAEWIVVAYGSVSRIVKSAIDKARDQGISVGLVRPISVWPFPSQILNDLAAKPSVKGFLAAEMSAGQMVEDVRLAVNGQKPVYFFGKMGGVVPTPTDILAEIENMVGGKLS